MTLQAELAVSVGSACNAGLIEPSYVLGAIGLDGIDQPAALICEKAHRLSHMHAAA